LNCIEHKHNLTKCLHINIAHINAVKVTESAPNLGVVIDTEMTMCHMSTRAMRLFA